MSFVPPHANQVTVSPNYLHTSQLVTAGLVVGCCCFALVASFIVFFTVGGAKPPFPENVVLFVGIAGGLLQAMLSFVIPSLIVRGRVQNQPPTDASNSQEFWESTYFSQHIIGCALLEGGAFFNLIALMIDRQWWSLGVAAVLMLVLLLRFPTESRMAEWIETQRL